jgi:hypothetical protein
MVSVNPDRESKMKMTKRNVAAMPGTNLTTDSMKSIGWVVDEHRGVEVTAERVDDSSHWRPIVDGDYVGKQTYLSSRDALRAARMKVDRNQGVKHETKKVEAEGDPDWIQPYREAIR